MMCFLDVFGIYMGVSLNGGTPISNPKRWSFVVGVYPWLLGTTILGNLHIHHYMEILRAIRLLTGRLLTELSASPVLSATSAGVCAAVVMTSGVDPKGSNGWFLSMKWHLCCGGCCNKHKHLRIFEKCKLSRSIISCISWFMSQVLWLQWKPPAGRKFLVSHQIWNKHLPLQLLKRKIATVAFLCFPRWNMTEPHSTHSNMCPNVVAWRCRRWWLSLVQFWTPLRTGIQWSVAHRCLVS